MAVRNTDDLLGRHPYPELLTRQLGPEGLVSTQYNELQDTLTRSMSRVRGDDDTALVSSDGGSGSTIALYRMNLAAGALIVAGALGRFAAAVDTVLIGAGEWAKSWALDGSPAVVLTADGKTYDVAIVALLVDGDVELHAVFGDEADDASEVEPTMTTIAAALALAGITDLTERAGMIVARLKIQRVAVDTITMSHVDPATDDDLAEDRSASNIFGVQS
jgi:hypothetical protein